MPKKYTAFAILTLVFVAGALPIFFDVYRISLFKAVSYDDYAPYLLWLLGEPGGKTPQSPHFYRIGAVVLAAPFYYFPLVEFTGAKLAHPYQLATQAICIANIFYVSLSAAIVATYLHLRLRVGIEWAAIAAFIALQFSRYEGIYSTDGIATLPMVLLILSAAEQRLGFFSLFLAIGAVTNEKTIIASFILVFLRTIFVPARRWRYLLMLAANAGALALYILAINVIVVPGNEYQRHLGTYLPSAISMVALSLSAKGFYINVWPPLLLIALWAIAITAQRQSRFTIPVDIGVVLGLMIMSLLLDVEYAVGRIVMYSLPLYLIGAVQALAHSSRDWESPLRPSKVVDTARMEQPSLRLPGQTLAGGFGATPPTPSQQTEPK